MDLPQKEDCSFNELPPEISEEQLIGFFSDQLIALEELTERLMPDTLE